MSKVAAELVRFCGYVLRAVAVMLIAFIGPCACVVVSEKGGFDVRRDAWAVTAATLVGGLALWAGGGWLIRLARQVEEGNRG